MSKKKQITPENLAKVAAQVKEFKENREAQGGGNSKRAQDPAVKAAKEAERAAKKAEREVMRESRKAERAQQREERKAQRAALRQSNTTPSFQRKIEKLSSRLPALPDHLAGMYQGIQQLSSSDLTTFVQYALFESRKRVLEGTGSATNPFNVGDRVMIRECSHNPKFNGKEGKITNVRRIRAFVAVDGFNTEAYCFVSELERIEEANLSESSEEFVDGTGTEG